jgi:integrase
MGKVTVENIDGRLRIRFSYGGVQRAFHIGLGHEHIKQAELIAKQLELDIATGQFNGDLDRYKQHQPKLKEPVRDGFRRYFLERTPDLAPNSLQRYRSLLNHLEQSPLGRIRADAVLLADINRFVERLSCSNATTKQYLELLRAAGLSVPDVKLKAAPKRSPKPFSREEISVILAVDNHYNSFIRFLAGSGCRIGEARALRFGHISDSAIVISSAFDRWDNLRTTKTGKSRTLPITESLRTIFASNDEAEDRDHNQLVFTSPSGGIIDHWVFGKAWQKILVQAGVEYRNPYNLRSTFISHCLHAGLTPIEVASLVGNSPRTIYEHYAGLVSIPKIPIFF